MKGTLRLVNRKRNWNDMQYDNAKIKKTLSISIGLKATYKETLERKIVETHTNTHTHTY